MKKLILLFFIPIQLVFAQPEINLDSCYKWALENYPNLKKAAIWEDITVLRKENIEINSLPTFSLNGQITYQSDVPGIDIPLPNISIPSVSKDQYKAYLAIKQSIWDGGISDARLDLENAILKSNLSQLNIELYKLNAQVADAFFTALAMSKQKEVLLAQKEVLKEKLRMVESGVENEMVEKSDALILMAEILNFEQNEVQLNAGKAIAIQMLSILTRHPILESHKLTFNIPEMNSASELNRPEIEYFSAQSLQLDNRIDLLQKTRNPKLFGFGQAGLGKPGLNLLNNDFDSYYLIGVGMSWTPFDWKKTSRNIQLVKHKQSMIFQEENTFRQNIQLLLAQQEGYVNQLNNILKKDSQIIELRNRITKAIATKLENGVINSSDYVQELQAETSAKLNYELHKIQLYKAKIKFNLIRGIESTENTE